MAGKPQQGTLVIADLSGFTEFVTSTELEHGPQVTKALLETVMSHLAPPLQIQELEGDAVFGFLPDRELGTSSTLLDVFDSAYVAFREKQRTMQFGTTCPCQACQAIPTLTLKFVAHHGSYVQQSVGGRSQLAGSDVILVHRLLKNTVPGRAYLLLSEAALGRTGLEPGESGLAPHTEHYEHVGEVLCYYGDLEPAWQRTCEQRRVRVEPEQAFHELHIALPVAPPIAWDWVYSPKRRIEWLPGLENFEQKSPGRFGLGTESHCDHGSTASYQTILDWRPFDYATVQLGLVPGGFRILETTDFEPVGENATMMHVRWARGEMGFVRNIAFSAIRPKFEKICRETCDSLKARIEAELSS